MNNLQQKLNHLKWLKAAGITYYCSERKDSKNSLIKELNNRHALPMDLPVITQPAPIMKKETGIQNESLAVAKARTLANNATTLAALKEAVEQFDGCDLKKFANNTVFADGVLGAKILLIGEAPGATEDEQGIPFCGESGQLLDKMLEAIGISRTKNAYITNTIFWRPPANRKPTNEEINICKPFVEKHIALINPKLIILVGSTAATSLLGKYDGITNLRQNNYSYTNQYLAAPIHRTSLFHPAYLLRQPMQKKTTWYDLLKIKAFIEESVDQPPQ